MIILITNVAKVDRYLKGNGAETLVVESSSSLESAVRSIISKSLSLDLSGKSKSSIRMNK